MKLHYYPENATVLYLSSRIFPGSRTREIVAG